MRKPKTNRVPRTRAGGEWTEAGYWGFIRSGLRKLSTRWPPRAQILRDRRRAYDGPNKRQKWEYPCSKCGGWFMQKEVHVDHIKPCGKLTSHNDLPEFVATLLCETDNLQILCKACHGSKSG